MIEATLPQAQLMKKLIDCVKDLVTDANWDCNDTGIALQAMDNSHVALVSILLRADGFDPYRCDRNVSLGINLASMSKILKCAGGDDKLTLTASDQGDVISFQFESPKGDRVCEYDLKLMDIDSDHLGIPDTEYEATFSLPSSEFLRIVRDLSSLSDSVTINVSKEGVKFSGSGDVGSGNIMIKQNMAVDDEDELVSIQMEQPVSLMFSLKYLNGFAKAAPLSDRVTMSMSSGLPSLIEYKLDEIGYLRFYLAPKIDEDE